jgi:hypothetical protein
MKNLVVLASFLARGKEGKGEEVSGIFMGAAGIELGKVLRRLKGEISGGELGHRRNFRTEEEEAEVA